MVRNNLNVSETAAALYTSQPGVSKQIRQLEDEVGVEIFERSGRQMVAITPAGKEIIRLAEQILATTDDIKSVGRQYSDPQSGELRLATTHTQARYVLPRIIEEFGNEFPRVNLHLHQGTPAQMAQMADSGEVDLVIATEGEEHYGNLELLPCYQWNRSVIVKPDHALFKLSQIGSLTLEALVQYPIITYVFGFTGRSQLDQAFHARQLEPNVVLTATDADVIKTYVRHGLGVGIIASMAFEDDVDSDLRALDASHLFESATTYICLRKGRRLPDYLYAFAHKFSANLTRDYLDSKLSQ